MSAITDIMDRVRSLNPERALGLKPAWPRVALELDRNEFSLVRLKPRRGGRPLLEANRVTTVDDGCVPATIFDATRNGEQQLQESLREIFQSSGTRPARVALVLPDNLAKVSLLNLPERPASNREFQELIRFKMRRAVPYRLTDARITHQVLPSDGPGIAVLVAVIRSALLERYEAALEAIGARPGLVDLATPNLLNLCRDRIRQAAESEGDVALLNCAKNYFSLVIVRNGKLIFYRCKSYSLGEEDSGQDEGLLLREVSSSISYYQEKLEGQGIGTMIVRSVDGSLEEVADRLRGLDVQRLEGVDPTSALDVEEPLAQELAQRIAPAAGAALGR